VAAIARAADVATADVKIDKIEEVCTRPLPSVRAPNLGWRACIPGMTRRLPSPDNGSPEEAAGGKHPRRDEHQGRRPERCYCYGQQAHGQQVSILSLREI
jgi:hypothetical protein